MLNRVLSATQWAAVTAVAAAILVGISFQARREGPAARGNQGPPVIVDVRGDVGNPGVHLLKGPARTVGEALAAAGGSPVELASEIASQPVRSGRSIRVVRKPSGGADVSTEAMPAAARLSLGLKLDVNEAAEEDLVLVPGLKPEVAKEIVRRRGKMPFQKIDELIAVSGVGPRSVAKWRDYLSASGAD